MEEVVEECNNYSNISPAATELTEALISHLTSLKVPTGPTGAACYMADCTREPGTGCVAACVATQPPA